MLEGKYRDKLSKYKSLYLELALEKDNLKQKVANLSRPQISSLLFLIRLVFSGKVVVRRDLFSLLQRKKKKIMMRLGLTPFLASFFGGLTLAGLTLAGLTLAGLTLAGLGLAGLTLAGLALAGLTLAGLALAGLTLAGLALAGLERAGLMFKNVYEFGLS